MEGGKPFHSPPSQLHHAAKIIKQPIYQACIMYLAKTMRLSDLGLGRFSKKHESNPTTFHNNCLMNGLASLDSALVHASVRVRPSRLQSIFLCRRAAPPPSPTDPTDYVLCLSKLANENAARQTEWERERDRPRAMEGKRKVI